MSYFAEGMLKKIEGEKAYYDSLGREPAATTAQPAAAAVPAPPDPRSFTYDAPPGAEDPSTPTGRERRRFADAGVPQNETYRLLGGPRQTLGG